MGEDFIIKLLLLSVSAIGVLLFFILKLILSNIKEIKEEVKILRSYDSRITKLEQFKEVYQTCNNFIKH